MTAHILYVEDAKFDRALFSKCFNAMARDDLSLHCAASVEAATDLMRECMPDVLFLDNSVPPYRSFAESLAVLQRAGFDGPVVVLTGLTTCELQHKADSVECIWGLLDKSELTSEHLSEVITPLLCPSGDA